MTTNRSYAVVGHVQHAQGKQPAQHKAAQVVPGHGTQQPARQWSPEAIAAMSAVGLIALVIVAVCVLLLGKLVMWVCSGKSHREAAQHGSR